MPIETLRPNASGSESGGTPVGAATVWECVDEAVADDDSTYVENTGSSTNSLNLQATALTNENIVSVKAVARNRHTSPTGGGDVQVGVRLGSSNSMAAAQSTTTSYANYEAPNLARPGGGSWSPSDLNSLQVRVVQSEGGGGNNARGTQWWVEIDYLPPTQNLTPSPLAVPVVIPQPTLLGTLQDIEPDPVTLSIAIPAPSLSFIGRTFFPSPVVIPLMLPGPSIAGVDLSFNPASLALPVVLPEPIVTHAYPVAPSPRPLPIVLPAPAITSTLSLAPVPVVISLSVTEVKHIRRFNPLRAGDTGLLIQKPDFTDVPGLAGMLTALSWETHRYLNQVGNWKAAIPVNEQLIDGIPLQRQLKAGWRVSMLQENNNPQFNVLERWLMYQGIIEKRRYQTDVSGTARLELEGSFRGMTLAHRLTYHGLEFSGTFDELAAELVEGDAIIGAPGGTILPTGANNLPIAVTFDDKTKLGALLLSGAYARYNLRESWDFDRPEFVKVDGAPYSGVRLVAVEKADVALDRAAEAGIGLIGEMPTIATDASQFANRIIALGSDFDEGDFLTLGDVGPWPAFDLNFPIHEGTNPDGSKFYYIEDPDSMNLYDRVDIRVIRTDIRNPSDDPDTREQAASVLYAMALGELLRRRSPMQVIDIPVANGSQIWMLPGDTTRLQYTGNVKDRNGVVTWAEIDNFFLVAERHDYSDPSGVRRVEFRLAAPELDYVLPGLPDPVDEGDETPRGGFSPPGGGMDPAPPAPVPPPAVNPCCPPPNVEFPGTPPETPPPLPPSQVGLGENVIVGRDTPEDFVGENPMITADWEAGNNPEMGTASGITVTVDGDYIIGTRAVVSNPSGIGSDPIDNLNMRVLVGGTSVLERNTGAFLVGDTFELSGQVIVRNVPAGTAIRWDFTQTPSLETILRLSPGGVGLGQSDPDASWISAYRVINAPCQPLLGEICP